MPLKRQPIEAGFSFKGSSKPSSQQLLSDSILKAIKKKVKETEFPIRRPDG